MVCVPTPDEEDVKRTHCEREHLVQERLRIENRIEALLFTQSIRGRPSLRSWEHDVAALRTGDGRELLPFLRAELDRLRRRLFLALELIRELETERAKTLNVAATDDLVARKIVSLPFSFGRCSIAVSQPSSTGQLRRYYAHALSKWRRGS